MQALFSPRRAGAAAYRRSTSRRCFLTDSARLAAAGALALTAAPGSPVAAQTFADFDRLNGLLALEHLAHALYRDALETFDADEFDEERPASVYPSLTLVGRHEAEHVAALQREIANRAATAGEEGRYAFGYKDIDGFLVVAAAIESVTVAAYVETIPAIADRGLHGLLTSNLAVEARHSSYLNARLARYSFLKAFEPASTPGSVRAVVELYTQDSGLRIDD